MRFLIVDDQTLNRRLLEAIVAPYGETATARNGREGLDAFRAALDAGRPFDVVFMDIMMPEMNGHQALESIRRAEAESGVPAGDAVKVIMVTAMNDIRNVSRAFFTGQAVAYLDKPVDGDKVREVLLRFGLIPAEQEGPAGPA
jgi:two-component system chemotaxis response regulator CheY